MSTDYPTFGIPESCYSGITTSIVALAEAKEELILKENKLFEETKEYCRAQMALNPGFQRMYSFLLQEWTKQHVENIEKINCTGPRDIFEKRFYQYTAVDEYSRWKFRMIYDTQCEFSALQFIRRLHMSAPFQIKKVQTDNGSEFTSKYLKNHGPDYLTCFESYLLSADIRYYQIPKGKPWHNGRVECTHRLDRERFYNRLEIKSLDQANHELEIYNIEFNQYPRKCMKWKNATTMVQEYNKELLCKEC